MRKSCGGWELRKWVGGIQEYFYSWYEFAVGSGQLVWRFSFRAWLMGRAVPLR
jgi:hypothetical protein